MRLSRFRVLILSLLLASITLWVTNQQTQTSNGKVTNQITALGYSWQASDTTIWNLSPSEPLKQSILQAQTILYKDSEKISEYQQPRIELIEQDNTTILTSNKGKSFEDKILNFTENVVITQKTDNQPNANTTAHKTVLKTEDISYNLNTNELTTDAKVTITQYNGQINGVGLKANLKTSDFELLSNVKTTYYPQKTQTPVEVKEP